MLSSLGRCATSRLAPTFNHRHYLTNPSTYLRSSSSSSSIATTPPFPQTTTPQNHHDLQSFLAYASRVNLPPETTTYVGTHYEYTVLASLRRLGFTLSRVGGRADSGIDLIGTWTLPSLPTTHPLKVLVQCKAHKRAPGPHLIRELEGAFAGAPPGWRGGGVLGILVTVGAAGKGVREAIGRSGEALGFFRVREGRVEQGVWNRKAEEVGLSGVGVGVRYFEGEAGEGVGKEVVLTWKGRVVEDAEESKLQPLVVSKPRGE